MTFRVRSQTDVWTLFPYKIFWLKAAFLIHLIILRCWGSKAAKQPQTITKFYFCWKVHLKKLLVVHKIYSLKSLSFFSFFFAYVNYFLLADELALELSHGSHLVQSFSHCWIMNSDPN